MPKTATRQKPNGARAAVLDGIPVTQHRMTLAGTETAVLVGGDGPPLVLLPGPGESALWWARVMPQLTERHRVVAPDLPGTGESDHPADGFDPGGMLAWLDDLIDRACSRPPVLVGHAIGGALAARYAVRHQARLAGLVLVDTLGLRRFLPAPSFGFRLFRFLANPTEESYRPFFDTCMYSGAATRQGLGRRWEPFLADYLRGVQDERRKDAIGQLIKHVGSKRIDGLERITVPTTLIWGRNDKATPLRAARAASRRYRWPLHVIDACGDDPKLERPEAFLEALDAALARVVAAPKAGPPRRPEQILAATP